MLKLFEGRISRGHFWLGCLVYSGVWILLPYLVSLLHDALPKSNMIDAVLILPVAIAMLFGALLFVSLIIRRLHDTNKSGLYILVIGLPFVGQLVLFYFLIQKGDSKTNHFGTPTSKVTLLRDIFKFLQQ
jgi:uncharacterized membrane protein YhaH (DUF805 family)